MSKYSNRCDDSLREEISADLGIDPGQLDENTSFLELGLDSMRLMAWMHRLRKHGHKVTLRALYEQPSLKGWRRLLHEHPSVQEDIRGRIPAQSCSSVWPTMADGAPFPLTPVQHAYFVGRAPHQVLGGVGCHLYQEFEGTGLEADALEQAVSTLTDRHKMLSVTFLEDGRQQFRPGTRWRGLTLHDFRTESPEACEAHLRVMRARNGHRVLDVMRGENFDFQLSLLPENRHILHVNIDLLVMDAASFSLLFDELAALLSGETALPTDQDMDTGADYDFKSYLAQTAQENAAYREQARHFWLSRIETLPEAPQLPLACEPAQSGPVRMSRRRVEIQEGDWTRFKTYAGKHGVTPTMALATCFGAILARWCGQSRLLLNFTLFDRLPLHPAVEGMIADFTNILLLDIQGEGASLASLAQANQRVFAEAYEHRHWSGVELLRELKKRPGVCPHGVPVVFTSMLGRPLFGHDTGHVLGSPGWGISQTPQVWIDHLAYEHGTSLFLQWDCNEALFLPGLVDTLFQAYVQLVKTLIVTPQSWQQDVPDLMPREQRDLRERMNHYGEAPALAGLLHDGFWQRAMECPEALALIHGEQRLTYGELAALARCCAGALVEHNVQPGDRVAITMSKGIGQIIAVLGILYAGAVYVPVSPDQPLERRRTIYQGADAALVLVDDEASGEVVAGIAFLNWQEASRHRPVAAPYRVSSGDPAYIIYTSGSTGTPKGVVISHHGALNTCATVSHRYAVGRKDRVLALSALHFDLSVYDIFGLFSAGGALVLPDESWRRNPAAWCDAIERHGVTLWNTVPALFDMLLTYSEGFDLQTPSALRVVMLSGDWIGLDLPGRYRAFRPDGQFVAMGGATEASIWSNVYDVGELEPEWRSIPYGYPLARQKYRVVDSQGRDCPDWVPGELWIGGDGVALGYFNDPERSAAQFVTFRGERWYRTGDMGCYWPDGRLEFIGRRDRQVKIGGYRIELGEVEAALLHVDGVRNAAAMAIGEREKSLMAFVVPQGETLQSRLPVEDNLPASYASLITQHPPDPESGPDFDALLARLVAEFLFDHLNRHDVCFSAPVTVEDVLRQYGAAPVWSGLARLWLSHLSDAGFLRKMPDDTYIATGQAGKIVQKPAQASQKILFQEVENALLTHHAALAGILRGERPAHILLDHPFWAPEQLLLRSQGAIAAINNLADLVRTLAERLKRPVRLHEIGARSGLAAERLLSQLDATELAYTGWDDSPDMGIRASARLQKFGFAEVRHWHSGLAADVLHQADMVWSANALHRLEDAGIQAVLALAAPEALICVHELGMVSSSLSLVSTGLLVGDVDRITANLRDISGWNSLLAGHGLCHEAAGQTGAMQWMLYRAPRNVFRPDSNKLLTALRALLPAYMLPQRLFFLESLPLTANGKVNHHALAQFCKADGKEARAGSLEAEPLQGNVEQELGVLWCELLNVKEVFRESDFFRLGGDSLLATRLIGRLGGMNYEAQLADLFDYPNLANFAATLRRGDIWREDSGILRHNPEQRFEPFALTDVQEAYLVGRQPGFPLGGVGSHFFITFEVDALDIMRFEQAVNWLVERHDALRMVVRGDRQQVLKTVPDFTLNCHYVADLYGAESMALRQKLARQVLDPSCWPVFDIQAAQEEEGGKALLFICLDNLVLDGLSMQILLAELEQLYQNPDPALLRPLEIGFRDYLEHIRQREVNETSRAYWARRLETLPPAPGLPLLCDPEEVETPHFSRLSAHLAEEQWSALKLRCREEGLTPSALLLAAYAATLSAWADCDDLCLNLTLFDRDPLHPQIEQVLGDFTTLLLLVWQSADDWRGSARQLQQRLRQDLLHRDVSAIHVMRDLARRRCDIAVGMPVVFTSALGFDQNRFLSRRAWMKPQWGLSQTPQIWLDHQVYETDGELHFNWDYVRELFGRSQIETIFGRYVSLLKRLAQDETAWAMKLEDLVPRSRRTDSLLPVRPRFQAGSPADMATDSVPLRVDDPFVQSLCHYFEQITGQVIQPRQSFFDAGATSLRLVQLHVRLKQAGYSTLQVTDLFIHVTPLALAAHLHGASNQAGHHPIIKEERRDLLARRRIRAQQRRGSSL